MDRMVLVLRLQAVSRGATANLAEVCLEAARLIEADGHELEILRDGGPGPSRVQARPESK